MKPFPSAPRLGALLLPLVGLALLLALLGGFPRVAEAQAPAPSAIPPAFAALRINEFMASNNTVLEDPDDPDQYPDWIEIYNPGNTAVNLADQVSITDDATGNPEKWVFPAQALIVPANGYLILYADNEPDQGPAHLDFALSAGGEEIGLFYVGGGAPEEIDRRAYGPQTPNVSEGRRPDGSGAWGILPAPTPGASNDQNPPVIVSVTRTVAIPQADNPVTVVAEITDNGTVQATLFFTTSTGGESNIAMTPMGGNKYQAPIAGHGNGVYVSYWVTARDNDDNERQSLKQGYLVGYVPPVLVINEVVAENRTQVEDLDDPGDYPDWMELYNPGPAPVQLQGLSLTDTPREPEKYTISQAITLDAGEFILVYLDNDPAQSNAQRIHTNFALDKNGDFIGVFGGRGTAQIDGFAFGQQQDNVGLGRLPDGAGPIQRLLCTSPGAPNINCVPKALLPILRNP